MTYRLLKLVVQPVLVEDDGENLTERPAKPVEISAKQWPGYADKLAAEVAAMNQPAPEDGPTED